MSDHPPHLRLLDHEGRPRPGHAYPGWARLTARAVGAAPYALEPGRWYRVLGWLPLPGDRRQWLLEVGAGEEPLPVDAYLLDFGADDPAAWRARAAAAVGDGPE